MHIIFANDAPSTTRQWLELVKVSGANWTASSVPTIEDCCQPNLAKADCFVLGIDLKDTRPQEAWDRTVRTVGQLIDVKAVPVIFVSTLSQKTMGQLCDAIWNECDVRPVNLGFASWQDLKPRLEAVARFGQAE